MFGSPVAQAAEVELKGAQPRATPVVSWTGFYIGAEAGVEWGSSNTFSPISCCAFIPSVFADINNHAVQQVNSSGATLGVEAGYNWQFSPVVVGGIEVDYSGFWLSGRTAKSAAFTNLPPFAVFGANYTNSINTDWLLTARARLGFLATPSLLAFATGGVAVTDLHYAHMFSEGNGFGTPDSTSLTSVTSVRTGYAVGGGFEYLLAPSWSVKAEYLYLGGFGTLATAPAPVVFINPAPFSSVFNHSVTFTANVVRIGLNYRFK